MHTNSKRGGSRSKPRSTLQINGQGKKMWIHSRENLTWHDEHVVGEKCWIVLMVPNYE